MIEQLDYLTPEGCHKLEERLKYLTDVRRPQVIEQLRESFEETAALYENAEYFDALNEQTMVEAEIARLETILSNRHVESAARRKDSVDFGAIVTIREKYARRRESYQLVGSAETDPEEGRISIQSPLGKALLGKKVGDTVVVQAPDGELVFRVMAIR